MKRDMDLIRQIALTASELEPGTFLRSLEGVPIELFNEHVRLMVEAGLVHAFIAPDINDVVIGATVSRLTWEGHDFADAARDDTLWRRAKESVIKPSASFTFGLLKDWLKSEIQQGLPTFRALGQ